MKKKKVKIQEVYETQQVGNHWCKLQDVQGGPCADRTLLCFAISELPLNVRSIV